MSNVIRTAALSTVVAALAGMVATSSCAPATQVVQEWKAPGPAPAVLSRPLVVFQTRSETLRRSVEDALAARIPNAVAGYTILSEDDVHDVARAREKIRASGFDTVLVARMLDVNRRLDVAPGPPPMFGPMWSAWDYGYLNEPMIQQNTVVTLETLVYTLDPQFGSGDGELVFATQSETFDPHTVKDLATAIVHASLTTMRKQGVAFEGEPVRP